jgi:hypothetical protein
MATLCTKATAQTKSEVVNILGVIEIIQNTLGGRGPGGVARLVRLG